MKNREEMKLELKHLAPYMPYGLRVHYSGLSDDDISGEFTVIAYHAGNGVSLIDDDALEEGDLSKSFYVDYDFPIKPILRPLSSMLWSEATYINNLLDTGVFLFVDDAGCAQIGVTKYVQSEGDATVSLSNILAASEYLFKKHFDVFGLINKGLAVEK